MSPTAIGGDLFDFPVGLFVESSALNLAVEMDRGGFRGAAFGASGGIDSLTTASLCLRASEKRGKSQVVVLQMNDARVKGELYNPELYRVLGADLIQIDITTEAIRREKHLGMPPRWLTACLLKLALRWLPMRARRRMILAVEAGRAPGWVLSHYQLLTLLHRLRIARLREYAASHRLMLVICANLTEVSLGYFVEQGVDDPQMGDCAPLSGVYKSQVRTTAKFVGLPEHIMSQRPSPGFGGVYDEEIIGPYEIVDLILLGCNWVIQTQRSSELYGLMPVNCWRQAASEEEVPTTSIMFDLYESWSHCMLERGEPSLGRFGEGALYEIKELIRGEA